MFLTADELRELTGLERPHAQRRWLTERGIESLRRADGQLVVAREAVLERLGVTHRPEERLPEPDWSALS